MESEKKDEKTDQDEYSKPFWKSGQGMVIIAIGLVLLVGSFANYYRNRTEQKNSVVIKDKIEKFIKENLVQPGTELKIEDFQKEGGLYKLTIAVGEQKITSYASLDGNKFFPEAIDLEEKGAEAAAVDPNDPRSKPPVTEASQKQAVPEVELFVMSLCPYGVQAEKGILPAIQKLGSKTNFRLRFVDYTLHGKPEFDENLKQYCIQKEEPAKLLGYLACFNKDEDSVKCTTTARLIKAKIDACIAQTDKEFKLNENFSASGQSSPFGIEKELNEKYGIQGSPSLVINGEKVNSGRDAASYLKAICSGFTNPPAECQATLSSETPAPGFGDGKSANGAAAASCN